MTELSLVHDIRKGDRTAMRRLYDCYAGYALAVGLRYIPNHDEVKDVVQDSFLRILTHLEQFNYKGEGSLRAWVARIVAHEAIDHMRRNERFQFVDEMPDDTEDDNPDVEHVPPDVLTAMIGRLPVGYRVVLNMFVFEQMSHKEIAQRLGIKENSSASQFFRAKKMLAKMINDYIKTGRI